MTLPQQKFREIVLTLLYSAEMGGQTLENSIPLLMQEHSISKRNARLALDRAREILNAADVIDDKVRAVVESYRFERIHAIMKNVLRIALFELLYEEDIPPKVAFAEGMRLCKKYSTPEAVSFINAIMDAIYKQEQGEEFDGKTISQAYDKLLEEERNIENKKDI
ncbi:MAG: transcription antitermination factor NusB [Chlamydiales bacterium]